MKTINAHHTSHEGHQPIRVLSHNLIGNHENTHAKFLKAQIEATKKGLQAGISYYVNDFPILNQRNGQHQIPNISADNKINIHETFCSYLWCISYSIPVFYDEGIAKANLNLIAGKEEYKIDTELLNNVQQLFDYAMTVITAIVPWDKAQLVNPELYSEEEKFWVERANSIYLYAANFMLCHEFAHFDLGHLEMGKRLKLKNHHWVQLEREADQHAIKLLMKGNSKQLDRTLKVGILIGMISLLFLNRMTVMTKHPHTDERIHSFLMQLQLEDNDPLWAMACIGYKLWDSQFNHSMDFITSQTSYRKLYFDIKKQFQEVLKWLPIAICMALLS
ncbi:phage exclusion protein Lit family protein [Pedobacter sp. MR22-3]|uniref:phage exclusion protein Lit family protein n=1 Tax=Pedobacter TaxID=84567 RepID=UPI0022484C4F|nr:phage exclusion protein Lit family protein [Pedobacter sp. MR22-3]MCX2585659.1 phage exclusion protein Lit family protein [Pedobacter sp. MR22-3]